MIHLNNMKTYLNHHIEKTLTGWFTCFIVEHGTLKADSLAGIKELVKKHLAAD